MSEEQYAVLKKLKLNFVIYLEQRSNIWCVELRGLDEHPHYNGEGMLYIKTLYKTFLVRAHSFLNKIQTYRKHGDTSFSCQKVYKKTHPQNSFPIKLTLWENFPVMFKHKKIRFQNFIPQGNFLERKFSPSIVSPC